MLFINGDKRDSKRLSARALIVAFTICSILLQSAFALEVSDYNKVCGPILKKSQQIKNAFDPIAMKANYCRSAKDAIKAADSNSTLWKVWAAVAGVCASACAASVAGKYTNAYICAGANLAGSITDAAVTRQFMSALSGLATAGGSIVLNKTVDKTKDYGACVSFIAAGTQAYIKHASIKNNKLTAKQNIELAAREDNQNGNYLGYGYTNETDTNNNTSDNTPSSAENTGVAEQEEEQSDDCSASDSGNYSGVITCALASDSTLPPFVNSPKFPAEFKKQSGQNLEDFFSNDDPVKDSILSTLPGGLSAPVTAKMAEALDQIEESPDIQGDGATYSSGGGGGLGVGSGDPDMGALMQGVLSQFVPKNKDGTQGSKGISSSDFIKKYRSPDSVVIDRNISIFDRITFRYLLVTKTRFQGGKK